MDCQKDAMNERWLVDPKNSYANKVAGDARNKYAKRLDLGNKTIRLYDAAKADFDKLTPHAKKAFCLSGGQLV